MARTRLASDAARLIRNRQAIPNDQESHRMSRSGYRGVQLRDGRTLAYAEHGSPSGLPIIYCHGVPSSRVEGDLIIASAFPRCRATFYAEDAHLSVPLNHQEEIFGALATALSEAPNPGLPPTAAMER